MWRRISDLIQERRASKAAVAALAPMLRHSRQRMGGIGDDVWVDPYVVGFLVMLISIAARLEIADIGEAPLRRVQARAWRAVTSARGELMTEQLAVFDATRDDDFVRGCQDAVRFGGMLFGDVSLSEGRGISNIICRNNENLQLTDVHEAWVQFFDARIRSRNIDSLS